MQRIANLAGILATVLVAVAAPSDGAAREAPPTAAESQAKARLFVLTDIEADPDDTQSLIRLLLYSNEIDIEGLVATTSVWKRNSVAPGSITSIIALYGLVLPNLRLHDPAYPAADALAAIVSQGQPLYGMQGVGEDMDSPGSDALLRAMLRDDDRPLWVNAWGGANTLAQALLRLRQTHFPAKVAQVCRKVWVYAISDQDDAGPWIRREFPCINYIVTPGGDYGRATWGGMMQVIDGIDNTTISNAWIARNIQQDHGPLGAAYPDVVWGVEGDTPAFLGLIPTGLGRPEEPAQGGWGGRYELSIPAPMTNDPANQVAGVVFSPETRPIWTNAEDAVGPIVHGEYGRATRLSPSVETSARATIWRWRDAFQNDFAARMDWTFLPLNKANHPPVVRLQTANMLSVRSGEEFELSARGTSDPDGDSLSFLWFHYPEAGSWLGQLTIAAENADSVRITAPAVTTRQTLHIILAVTDKGSPPLTRYQRVVITVDP